MNVLSIDDIDVIVPNLGSRYSGITSTIERVVPVQSRAVRIAGLGSIIQSDIPKLGKGDLWSLRRRPAKHPFRIWHARRNDDMLLGLFLRDILRMPLALIFTSAAQRHHTWITRALIRRMDAVIATSPQSASYLQRPATVIPHGMDMVTFHPADDRQALRKKYGLPDKILIGCFGRVRHDKGTDLFADAFIKLAAGNSEIDAVVTGLTQPEDRDFVKALQGKISEVGLTERMHWLGEVPREQMADMYRCIDIFVAPQRKEGFGVTPLEAMASGVPVVATTAGTFTAQIADGETGYIVPLEDVPAIAGAVEKLVADPELRGRMALAGRERVGTHFSIEGEAEAINAVYSSVWQSKGRPGA